MSTCNVDVGHPCDANNGEPCDECVAFMKESRAEAWREWEAASPEERDSQRYQQDLIDAGRGHLVRR